MRITRAGLAWAAGAGLAVVASLGELGAQHVGRDFHVFWEAGRDFASGAPLYQPAPGARTFKYPPFAAMVFQPLGWLPLPVAAVGFHALGLLLLAFAGVATWRIADSWAPGRRRGPVPMVLAAAVVLHLAQSDLLRLQTNTLVLALSLAGVLAVARNRPGPAAAWITAATLIKLTPAVLLGWLAVRGGRRAPAFIAAALAVGLAAPVALRGPARGLRDHAEYARAFLLPVSGRVWARPQNQALGPALERALVPGAAGNGRNLAWLPRGPAAARVARRAGAVAVAGMVAGCLVLLARRRRPHNLFEVGAAMLAANLLSPITWKSHLVGLLLVAYAVFSLPLDAWPRASRRALRGLSALLLLSGLSGRSVTGDTLQAALFGYSAWTALLLVLVTACVVLALAPPERLGGGTGGRDASEDPAG